MSDTQKSIPQRTQAFEVFRYQLVVDRTLQMDMFKKYTTADEIKADKNNIFHEIIANEKFNFSSAKSEVTSKLPYQNGDLYYFKIGVKRSAKVYKKDFSEDTIDNYPNIFVVHNNHPDVQKIAIQENKKAFANCKTVSQILQDSLDNHLRLYNLSMMTEPLFDKKEFWNIINRYPKQVKQVTFDLISPNLANISKNLQLDIKQLHNDTNTHKTTLELNADKDSYLDIKEQSKFINSLVDYSADGGGNIQVRVANIRKKIHTAQSPTEFSIDDAFLNSNNWEQLDQFFNNILL